MTDTKLPFPTPQDVHLLRLLMVVLASSVPIGLLFIFSGLVSYGPEANFYLVTLHLFVAQDMWAGPLVIAIFAAALIFARDMEPGRGKVVPWGVWAVTLVSMALVFMMRFLAFHNYNLSIDEFFPLFQADIFRAGYLMAPLSDEAFGLRGALQPYFTYVDEDHRLWAQHYRPVHAAILALLPKGFEIAIAHSLLTGITVLAIANIARSLFPDRPGAPLFAACLLVASPQVILMGASGYAFTTHLAFNTVWLALFLKGSWTAHVAAAFLSLLALGIHQVHVHAIYAFPFGVALLLGYFGSRWKAVPYIVAAVVGAPFWIAWPEIATWLQTGDAGALPRSLLEVEYLSNYVARSDNLGSLDRQFSLIFLIANIWRFGLWMSPALVLLLLLALGSPRRLGSLSVILGLGVIFGVSVSHLMLPNPMLTIGSRYYHPFISSLILIALAAYYRLCHNSRFERTAVAVMVAGAIVLLPWRAWQVHEQIRPQAAIQAQLTAMQVESILIQPGQTWFGLDFVRNDPFLLEGPTFYAAPLGRDVRLLRHGPTATVSSRDLVEMGLPVGTWLQPDFGQ
jgi:hypothetical protein